MLSDRVELSSAEACVERLEGGSVGVFELGQTARARTHRLCAPTILQSHPGECF